MAVKSVLPDAYHAVGPQGCWVAPMRRPTVMAISAIE
jgi:hypothetical protein